MQWSGGSRGEMGPADRNQGGSECKVAGWGSWRGSEEGGLNPEGTVDWGVAHACPAGGKGRRGPSLGKQPEGQGSES